MSIILKVTEKFIKHKVGNSEIELPVGINFVCVDIQRPANYHSDSKELYRVCQSECSHNTFGQHLIHEEQKRGANE